MNKTIYSEQSRIVTEKIKQFREKKKVTQRELAKLLDIPQQRIGRIEVGERRVDIVELYWIFKACGMNPAKEASRLMNEFEQLDQ